MKNTLVEACNAANININTYYSWNNNKATPIPRFKPSPEDDFRGLAVLNIVLDHPKWGGEKIALELLKEGLYAIDVREAIKLKKTALEYIEKHGLGKKKPIRYEFQNVNDAWCMDIKEIKAEDEKYYLFKIIDDKSRFDLVSFVVPFATTEVAIDTIKAAIRMTGIIPKVMKTDRGPQFKVQFTDFLNSINIKHVKSIPYYPRCNSKMERVYLDVENNVCKEFLPSVDLEKIVQAVQIESLEHNYVNPHSSLQGLTPAELYHGCGEYLKEKMQSFCNAVKKKFDKIAEKAYRLIAVDEFIPGSKCDIEVKVF